MSQPKTQSTRRTLHDRFPYKWLALSVTSLGALMASMNSGTLIIALPTLLRDLHTTLLSLIWILLAYNVTQTAGPTYVGGTRSKAMSRSR